MIIKCKYKNTIKENKNSLHVFFSLFNRARVPFSLFLNVKTQWMKESVVLISSLILTFQAGFHNERVVVFKNYL